jgi:hypothetical protein
LSLTNNAQADLNTVTTVNTVARDLSIDPDDNIIYTPNRVIDGQSNTIIGVITNEEANSVAVDRQAHVAYFVAYDTERDRYTLSRFNRNNRLTEVVGGARSNSEVAVHSTTHLVYVTQRQGVSVFDANTNQPVTTITDRFQGTLLVGSVEVNEHTNTLFVTRPEQGTLHIIDGATNTVKNVRFVGTAGKLPLAINARTNTVFIVGAEGRKLIVFDAARTEVVHSIDLPFEPLSVAVNSLNNQVYIGGAGGEVATYDAGAGTIVSTFSVTTTPINALAVNERTNLVYTGSNILYVLREDFAGQPTDTTPPAMTLTSPSNGAKLSTLPNISGTAQDNRGGSGLDRVALFLRRSSDGRYWSGRNWATTAIELPSRLKGSTFTNGFELPAGTNLRADTYFITAIALDRAQPRANRSVVVSSVRIIDTTAPQVAFAYPINGQQETQLFKVQGTIADNEGGSGPSRVLLFIRRLSDGRYFDGTRWVTTAIALPTRLSGTGREVAWIYAGQLPPAAGQRDLYRLTAVGYDGAFNRSLSEVQVQVGSVGATT